MKRVTVIFFIITLLGITLAAAQSDDLVRVGYFEKDPVIHRDPELGATGFVRDLFEQIALDNDLELEFIHGSLPECLSRLQSGEIDMIAVLGVTTERNRIFDYSEENVLRTWGRVYVPDDRNVQSVLDLAGCRIGHVRNSFFTASLSRLLEQFGVEAEFVEFENQDALFEAISDYKVEAGISDRLLSYNIPPGHDVRPSPIVFNPFSLKTVVPKGDPRGLLKVYDSALRTLKADQQSYYYRYFEAWFGGYTGTVMPRWVLWGMAGLVMVFVFSLIFVHWLRQQVRARTLELAQSREDLRITLNSIGDAVISTDADGQIINMNPVAQTMTGWMLAAAREMSLQDVLELRLDGMDEKCCNPFEEIMKKRATLLFSDDMWLFSHNGPKLAVALSGAPIYNATGRIVGTVLVFRDVSQQRIDQQEAAKTRNLESIGILAGGIAHDFNNILTAIIGNLSLAYDDTPADHGIRELLKDAGKAADRARGLTQQLLTFSKGGEPIRRTESLREAILDSAGFVLSGSNVKCEYDIAEDLWLVDVDKGQISQVIQNIVLNARQAMSGGGRLKIVSSNISAAASDVLGLAGARYIQIEIEDEGEGIPEIDLERIFDPYFSSRRVGSGLGLAVCYSIVKAHGGLIRVDSSVGHGSVFRIFLPASDEVIEAGTEPRPLHESGSGRILIMDDESIIRRFTTTYLAQNGYQVLEARDGQEAIDIFKASRDAGQPIDLVITDLTVPGGLGGVAVLRGLREIDTDVPVIVSSGYSNDPVMARCTEYGFNAAVSKPYTGWELLATVHQVLIPVSSDRD